MVLFFLIEKKGSKSFSSYRRKCDKLRELNNVIFTIAYRLALFRKSIPACNL